MKACSWLVWFVFLLVCSVLFAPTPVQAQDLGKNARIANGEICNECGFGPAVVVLRGGGTMCTGTLVHPEVVLYAAHCGEFPDVEFTHQALL